MDNFYTTEDGITVWEDDVDCTICANWGCEVCVWWIPPMFAPSVTQNTHGSPWVATVMTQWLVPMMTASTCSLSDSQRVEMSVLSCGTYHINNVRYVRVSIWLFHIFLIVLRHNKIEVEPTRANKVTKVTWASRANKPQMSDPHDRMGT